MALVVAATMVAALVVSHARASMAAEEGGREDPTSPEPATRVERTAWLMGTRATVAVDAHDRPTALAASEEVLSTMADVEATLSTWRDDSELSGLNRTPPGIVAQPSTYLASLLAESARWSRRTEGAFHPAVGALVDAWDFRGEGRAPADAELREAVAASGGAGIGIDPVTGSVVRNDPAAWLDAGAFGKGAALREALRALRAAGVPSARVDLGGQLLVVGGAGVDVAHPLHRDRPAAHLRVGDASVATSGQSERGFDIDGERFGHVIDPRNGRPVSAWGTVTVVHPDPVAADILATALFVLGPCTGQPLATSLDVAALFLVVDGSSVAPMGTPALDAHGPTFSTLTPLQSTPSETCDSLSP